MTNIRNGGKTPVASMVHSIALRLIMLFFGKWAKLLPMSTLAAILVILAFRMSEWRSFRALLGNHGFDVGVLVVTFFLTVLIDLTLAIQVGILLAI
jgi:SulP family sulfate permease